MTAAKRLAPSLSSPLWSPAVFAGRFVELTGRARLTMAFSLILMAQQRREPVAWIASRGDRESLFFPPDAAECGIDLEALPCARVVDAAAAARAADLLLRSGAFGLVVLDLGNANELPMPLQSRLAALAQKHEAAVVCVTEKSEQTASLSSLVSLRAEAWRDKARKEVRKDRSEGLDFEDDDSAVTTASASDRLVCGVRILKDKQRGPGWGHAESLRGPPGLC